MEFAPCPQEILARAFNDLRIGLPVALAAGESGIAALAAETAGDDRLERMARAEGSVLAVTDRRAATLKARAYDGDIARLAPPPDVSAGWIRSVADPSTDLRYPMKGPFTTVRGGSARLCRAAVALTRCARLLPAALACPVADIHGFARDNGLTCIGSREMRLIRARGAVRVAASAALPLAKYPDARIRVFRQADGTEDHCAIEFGAPPRGDPVLTRLHSACFTGDVLDSLKCDCGHQLQAAIDRMAADNGGILLYLNQEGRGIGLANKVRAYALQDQGFDTVEANHRLGFEDDERDFRVGAEILCQLGFTKARLMTNNPAKVRRLEAQGIAVTERIPLVTGRTEHNETYLAVKARKSGHLL